MVDAEETPTDLDFGKPASKFAKEANLRKWIEHHHHKRLSSLALRFYKERAATLTTKRKPFPIVLNKFVNK